MVPYQGFGTPSDILRILHFAVHSIRFKNLMARRRRKVWRRDG